MTPVTARINACLSKIIFSFKSVTDITTNIDNIISIKNKFIVNPNLKNAAINKIPVRSSMVKY